MKLGLAVLIFGAVACKQGSADSQIQGADLALPGPEVFEGGPTTRCEVDGLQLTITFGPPQDYKWARLSDAPVPDGKPRVDYLQSDSSRVRLNKGELVSGRWQVSQSGTDPIEAKVFLDRDVGDCQLRGYALTDEQRARRT